MIASTFFALLIGCIAYFVGSTTRVFLNPQTSFASFPTGELAKPNVDALMPELLNIVIPESLTIVILILDIISIHVDIGSFSSDFQFVVGEGFLCRLYQQKCVRQRFNNLDAFCQCIFCIAFSNNRVDET